MYPEPLIGRSCEYVINASCNRRRTYRQRIENVDPSDRRTIYVGPSKIVIAAFAFAELNNVRISDKGTW